MIKAWTDYPIVELGDVPNTDAPIRECEVIGFDGDKYADVIVGGVKTSFKAGYLYKEQGRCGEVPRISFKELSKLPSIEL